MDEDQVPPDIVPNERRASSLTGKLRRLRKVFRYQGRVLWGDYNYAFLFTPSLPFMKKSKQAPPFFGLNDKVPVVLAFDPRLQHALAMLARHHHTCPSS